MSAQLHSLPDLAAMQTQPLAVTQKTAFAEASADQKQAALQRLVLMRAIDSRPPLLTVSAFIAQLASEIAASTAPREIMQLAAAGVRCSAASLSRQYAAYRRQGLDGLVPAHRGREHQPEGWEAPFLKLWNRPQKPSINSVVRRLQADFPSITARKARTLVKNLPARLGVNGPGRMGRNYYQQSIGKYQPRDVSLLEVGEIWQGDGHRVDVYLAHPVTGKIYRPELTLWIDVRSRYIVGWYLSDNESSQTTLLALCEALRRTRHKPLALHIDNGSGFVNRMMSDENTGFFARLGVQIIHSIPGCPRGKGHVERVFRTLEEDYSIFFDTYCGNRTAPEHNRRLQTQLNQRERALPSLQEWADGFSRWVAEYHQRPHRGLDGKTPAAVYAGLIVNEVPDLQAFDLRERRVCKIRRCMLRVDKRDYIAPELEDCNLKQVIAEYLLTDDASVRVLDMDGRWICDARLVAKLDYQPASRLQERRIENDRQKIVRLERHAAEARARARGVLGTRQDLEALDHFGTPALPAADETEAEGLPPLDLLDTDYGDLP